MVVYGIGSCDRCRAARRWLGGRGYTYRFHDVRVDGLERARLIHWADTVGWEALINRRSATWRALAETQRAGLDRDRALSLMLDHPTLIRRPVLEVGDRVLTGFRDTDYEALL